MNTYEIIKPIGLKNITDEVETICMNSSIYKRCGLKPYHLVIALDSGLGRTTFIEYLTDLYKQNDILRFSGGLDDYLEIKLDGSIQQLKQAFIKIDAAAVYTNEYYGVVAIDISQLGAFSNEKQLSEFIVKIQKICTNAFVVFFVSSIPTRNEERVIRRVQEVIHNIKYIGDNKYTLEDIYLLIEKMIEHKGIKIESMTDLKVTLNKYIEESNINTIKDAIAVADTLVFYADFSKYTPLLTNNSVATAIEKLNGRVIV